jgi:hypothetical protein
MNLVGFNLRGSEYTPRLVQHLQNVKVHKIAAGLMHSACLDGVPSSSDLCYICMNVPLLRRWQLR